MTLGRWERLKLAAPSTLATRSHWIIIIIGCCRAIYQLMDGGEWRAIGRKVQEERKLAVSSRGSIVGLDQ